MDYEMREYCDSDKDDVLSLGRLCLADGRDQNFESLRLSWLLKAPYGTHAWVVETQSRLVGFVGRLIVLFQAYGSQVWGNIGFDLAVHPSHRRRGIGRRLLLDSREQLLRRGVRISLGATNDVSSYVSQSSGTFVATPFVLGRGVHFFMPVTLRGRLILKAWSLIKNRSSISSPSRRLTDIDIDRQVDVRAFRPSEEELSELARCNTEFGRVGIVQTAPWLKWTLYDRPRLEPHFIIARLNGAVIGFLVYAVDSSRKALVQAQILDFGASSNVAPQAIRALLSNVPEAVDLWSAWAISGSRLADFFGATGFFSTEGRSKSYVMLAVDGDDYLSKPDIVSNFHISRKDLIL